MHFSRYFKAITVALLLACSISANATIIIVTDPTDVLTPGTMRFAVASQSVAGDTIMFAVPQVNINTGPINVAHNLVFIGNGVALTAIDGGGAWQLFTIQPGMQAIFHDMTIANGLSGAAGGGILNMGDLQLYDCLLHDNIAGSDGGAVSNGGTMIVRRTDFWNNTAGNNGGAIYLGANADVNIDTATFNDNTATRGGAVNLSNNTGSNAVFANVTFDNNNANDGAGVYVFGSSTAIQFSYCTFSNDSATLTGGGIAAAGTGSVFLDSVIFFGCDAVNSGGGIKTTQSLTVQNCLIEGNSSIDGAGMHVIGGGANTFSFTGTTFKDNIGQNQGGGMYLAVNGSAVTMNSCTFENNDVMSGTATGGAIYYFAAGVTTNIDSCSFSNSDAPGGGGAVFVANNDLVFQYCDFTNCTSANSTGGAVQAGASAGAAFTYSSFTGNQATEGGAVATANSSSSTVLSCTFSNNQALAGDGGAMRVEGHSINMFNSTFSGNSAVDDGGAIALVNGGSINGSSNTFSGNAAGGTGKQLYLNASIVWLAGNIIASGGGINDITNVASTINTLDYNLIGDTTGSMTTWAANDIVGGSASPLDPQVEPLADNGGFTFTHALPCYSIAVDVGDPGAPATDQIGQARVGVPDIGAFEFQGGSSLFNVTSSLDAGPNSLRFGIENTCADTITFDPTLAGQTMTYVSGVMNINRNLVIIGLGSANFTLDAGGSSQLFTTNFGDTVELHGLTLTNGSAGGNGGGIWNDAVLTLDDIRFTGNSSGNDGGAVYSTNDAIVKNCFFVGGSANRGAGFYNNGSGSSQIDSCTFIANNSSTNGGGMHGTGGAAVTYDITNCTFSNNTSAGDGAGLWLSVTAAIVNINSCYFSNNDCASPIAKGGSLYIYTTTNTTLVDSCTFLNSDATGGGGGIYLDNGTTSLYNCSFDNCTGANGPGGAVLVDGASADIAYSTFNTNTGVSGGAIGFFNASNSSLNNSTLYSNQSSSGQGGALFVDATFLNMVNSTFSGNTAATDGGAIAMTNNSSLNAISNTLTLNVSGSTLGEQVYLNSGTFALTSCILANGVSGNDIYNTGGTVNSFDYNLIGDTTNSNTTWSPNDLVGGTGGAALDPLLDSLAYNGGLTWTHSFGCGSPVADAGDPAAPGFDQIDQPRVGSPDIGAFERQSASGGIFTVLSVGDGTVNSLRYAIFNTCADTIVFDPSFSGGTLAITLGEMNIDRNVAILGLGSANLALDGGSNSRLFKVRNGKTVEISSIKIQNGDAAAADGGGIYNSGILTMTDVIFTNNNADEGGALFSNNIGNLIVDSCKFIGNTSTGNGGAVALFNHNTNSADFTSCKFLNNFSAATGGGIFADSTGTKTFNNCEVHHNTATFNGGGICATQGALFMDSSSVWGNFAANGGGIFFSNSSGFVIRASTFFSDTATNNGGAINAFNSGGFIQNCTFESNYALTSIGGAIYSDGGNIDLNSNTITQNYANLEGGGFAGLSGGLVLNFNNNIIAENHNLVDVTPDFYNIGGATITSGGYNYIGVGDATGAAVTWDANDITGLLTSPILADLGPLQDNGGITLTKRPLCSSNILDAGDPTNAPAADQLGQPRVGQPDIGSFELQLSVLPDATVSGSAVMCRNRIASDSLLINLVGTSPWNLLVSNGTGTISIIGIINNSFYFTPQDTGTYTIVMVSDANCTNFSPSATSIVIGVSDLAATIQSTTQATCATADGSATVLASGGGGSYGFLWTNGDTITTADSLAAGFYMVTVTDPSTTCITTAIAQVSNAGAPTVVINNITAISCNGLNDGGIDISVTGGSGNYQFLWSVGPGTEDGSGLDGGPHEITVLDLNTGCEVIETIMMSEPDKLEININATAATCGAADATAVAIVTGGTAAYTYNWSSGGNAATETGLAYGIYTIAVIDANGCTATEVIAISESGAPAVQIDSFDLPSCNAADGALYISASGTGTLTYDWNSGLSTSQDLTAVPQGPYAVEVSDASGCIGLTGRLLSNARPASPFLCIATVDSATQRNLIGWEKTSGLGIEKYWVYRESSVVAIYQKIANIPFDSLSQFIDTVSTPGQQAWRYQVRAIDSCGNGSWLSNSVSHKTIHVSATAHVNGDVAVLWNAYDGFGVDEYYIWRYTIPTGIELIDSVDFPQHLFIDTPPNYDSLFYRIEVKNPFPCVVTRAAGNNNTSKSNESDLVSPPVDGIFDDHLQSNLSVYPIPSKGLVTIELNQTSMKDATLTVYDVQGRVVNTSKIVASAGHFKQEIDLSAQSPGIYFLEVWTRDRAYNKKLIID
jgi:predicted outer membrane repeat protein